MKKILLILLCLPAAAVLTAAAPALWQSTPENCAKLHLLPGASAAGSRIFFNNTGAGAVIPGSEAWHLTDRGFTIAATIRLDRRHPKFGNGYGADGKFLYDHDIIASKGGEFVFGRRSDYWSDQLYFNFRREGKWSVPLVGTASIPPYGTYAHVAVTVRRENHPFRGQDGYGVTYFVNGEAVKEQLVNSFGPATPVAEPWRLGCGQGVRNDFWSFGGELTDTVLYDRVLTEEEILTLAVNSRPARLSRSSRKPVTAALQQAAEAAGRQASSAGKWLLAALLTDAGNGAPQEELREIISRRQALFAETDPAVLAAKWNESGASLKILAQPRALLLVNTGRHSGGTPLAGLYDCVRQQEMFGQVTPGWQLLTRTAAGQPGKIVSTGLPYTLKLTSAAAPYTGEILWQTEAGFTVKSAFRFSGGRLEMNLEAAAVKEGIFLDDVVFPYCRLRKLRRGTDRLLTPRMSGAVYERPIDCEVPQPWKDYPNGELTMQFHAYYDDLGGIYYGMEDPYGGCKTFNTRGRGGELEMTWTHPVSFAPAEKGGRSFRLSGKGVWELFDGGWYEAGQIYRRFLAAEAKWWPKELPRTSTPQWYRDNTLWILHLVFTPRSPYEMISLLKEAREYLELPFGLHYYEWFDLNKGEFPHFYAKPEALLVLNELTEAGIKVKPYIDNRTWCTHDGRDVNGRHYDFQFSAIAAPWAVRSREGAFTLEGSAADPCAVMCPAVPQWQDYIYRMVERLAGQGFHAIYHDEVTTAQPRPCFAANHGHRLNDSRNWLEHGYWPMLARLADLRRQYPELCHDSEDASEPYMQYLDGVCPYRWIVPGQVPLFVSIYSGRTQFCGRIYDHVRPGEPESFYEKMAVQLTGSEQLGWFTIDYLSQPEKRLYVKRLMHLRRALLPYFNGGRMAKPLKFTAPVPERTLLWGNLEVQKITTPKIHHSVFFDAGEKIRMIVWVNSSPEQVTVKPVLDPAWGRLACCAGTAAAPEYPGTTPALTLAPRSIAVWLVSADAAALRTEAERLQAELRRIQAFVPGVLPSERLRKPQALGADGTLHYDFERPVVRRCQPAYRGEGCFELICDPARQQTRSFQWQLEPDTVYELSLAVRKDSGVKGRLLVGNYDRSNEFAHYAELGGETPSDGVWYPVKVRFRTDAKAWHSGLYLYGDAGQGSICVDEIHLRKINK